MFYTFHPDAETELNSSVDHYEGLREGLGLEFANEIYATIQRILDFPKAWQILNNDIRRCIANRFPYGVIYYQRKDEIVILAVMQLSRKPDYWRNRSLRY